MHRDVVVDAVLTERSQPGSRVAEVVLVALGSTVAVYRTRYGFSAGRGAAGVGELVWQHAAVVEENTYLERTRRAPSQHEI